jgi:hypothetical protein
MTLVVSTAILYVVNAVILIAGQTLFPKNIVLGTHALSYFWAIFLSMGLLSIVGAFVMPFVGKYENSRSKIFSPVEWSALYFVVNFVTIWVISRFSEQFGLGVTSWIVVLLLAVAMDVVQGMVMMMYGQKMKK